MSWALTARTVVILPVSLASWRWPSGRRTACTQSVCPVQAAPDKGSCLVKLGPAGDC
jgi:hypothetical protein